MDNPQATHLSRRLFSRRDNPQATHLSRRDQLTVTNSTDNQLEERGPPYKAVVTLQWAWGQAEISVANKSSDNIGEGVVLINV